MAEQGATMKPTMDEVQNQAGIDPRRSANMARIRSRDTLPELAVRRALHRLGLRFRLHRNDLPGTPDIVLPGRKTIILVHGCFWHRHSNCRFAYMPKSRVEFWQQKFAANIARDGRVKRALRELGWKVLVIWECETWATERLPRRLQTLLRQVRSI